MVIASSRNDYFVMILWHLCVLAQAEEPLHCSTGGDRLVERDEELGEERVVHEIYFFTDGPYSSPPTTKCIC
jgi:hypothetical protein